MLFPKIHVHLEPQNVTLHGNTQLVKDLEMKSTWIRVDSKHRGWCPYKKTGTQGGAP